MAYSTIYTGGEPMDDGDQATLTDAEMRELEEFARSLVIGFVENQFKDMQVVREAPPPGEVDGKKPR